jgi:hypothetical protein
LRRYKREKSNWDSHIQNTKDYICRQTKDLHFEKIAVLGSGYLLDLPIDELLERCTEIHLYDVHHPKEVLAKYRNNAKVVFVEKDITGLSEYLYKAKKNSDVSEILNRNTQLTLQDADLVISLNILNQLDIILVDYLNEKMALDMETELKLRNKIQTEHINCLSETMSLLIADTEEIHINETGQESTNNLFAQIQLEGITSDSENWKWSFDTSGNYAEDAIVTFKVTAVTYNKRT